MRRIILRIQVTSVGGITTKQGKFKPYKLYDLEFIDQESGREKKRQMIEFNSGAAFQKLADSEIGSTWEVSTKPAKDPQYTDWVDATPIAAEEQEEAPKGPGKAVKAKVAGVAAPFKSTYETPEERARKQVYIVRQSSIANAIAYYKDNNAGTVANILALSKEFEAYVFGTDQAVEPAVPTVE
jgi:hypothetical protein